MLDTDELRGYIAKRGLSQAKVARAIGITPRGFRNKMKRAVFSSDELERMVLMLEIEKPWETLFKPKEKGDQA